MAAHWRYHNSAFDRMLRSQIPYILLLLDRRWEKRSSLHWVKFLLAIPSLYLFNDTWANGNFIVPNQSLYLIDYTETNSNLNECWLIYSDYFKLFVYYGFNWYYFFNNYGYIIYCTSVVLSYYLKWFPIKNFKFLNLGFQGKENHNFHLTPSN